MENKTKGLIGAGIATIAAGLFGFWKYKNMSPDEKAQLKAKARKAGDTIKETYGEVEGQVSDKLTQLKGALERETNKAKNSAQRTAAYTEDVIEAEVEKVS